MAKRKFKVTQRGEYLGKPFTVGFTLLGTDDNVTAFVGKLAGAIEVYEQNTSLSTPEGTSLTVTTGRPIEYIKMVKKGCQTAYISGNNPMVFKDSVSSVEIQEMCKLFEPFVGPDEVALNFKPTSALAIPAPAIVINNN